MAGTREGERRRWLRYWRGRLLYSVRGRATVVTVLVSALILVVCLVLGALLAQDAAENVVEERAERTVERVGYDLERGDGRMPIVTRPGEAALVQVVRDDQTVAASSAAARGKPALAAPILGRNQLLVDRQACPAFLDECVYVFGMRLDHSPFGGQVMLYAAAPLPRLAGRWLVPVWVLLIFIALLSLISWWTWRTIGTALVPVEAIQREMTGINASGLGHRVPVPDSGGEIQHLAETVNDTLERLEEALGRERRFVSDASHDLRNPIAGLNTRLEVALDEADDFDWRGMTREALRDAQRLDAIVADLLELSRLDSRSPMPVERVDLAGLARREIDRRQGEVPIEAELAGGAVVEASPVRLGRVLGNLLGNAERHAESGIGVAVRVEGGEAVLEVVDDGSGVPEESRERVFERFARLPESRHRDPAGTGLGLPIAREIAEIYGGSLRIADSARGARFVLRLPLAGP